MRRWNVGVAVFALSLAGTWALPPQADAQAAVGARAGLRWAEVEATPSPDGISGLVFGGYFGVGLSDRLALQIEGVYGTRGAGTLRIGTDVLDADAPPAAIEMSYIEVPILLRAGFPGDHLLPSVFFGPYVGFLLDCDLTPAGGEERSCGDADATGRFSPRSTDYGLVGGAAVDLALGESTIFVDARYTLGLLSLQSGDSGFDARHTGLALSGGFAVPLGR